MIKISITFLIPALTILSACEPVKSPEKGNENIANLSVQFGVKTESQLVNSNRINIKFGNKTTGSKAPQKFLNQRSLRGWTSDFEFPPSGSLMGIACQHPTLIGFIDVNLSEGPEVIKYIDLVEAVDLEVQILEPRSGQYKLKDFELMPRSQFEVQSNGRKHEVKSLCSVRYSHFPNEEFSPYFTIDGTDIIMIDDRRSAFDSDLSKSNVSMTEVTIMGVAEIEGQRVGFTATRKIDVAFK